MMMILVDVKTVVNSFVIIKNNNGRQHYYYASSSSLHTTDVIIHSSVFSTKTKTLLFDSKHQPFFNDHLNDDDDDGNEESSSSTTSSSLQHLLPAVKELVKDIWIEDEEWGIDDYDKHGPAIDNVVHVTLKNGKKFWASFYTYDSIETIRMRYQRNGESLNGKYFCDNKMILIGKCSRKDIEIVINHILVENDGTLTPEFTKVNQWYELWITVSCEVRWRLRELLSKIPLATRKGKGPLRKLRKRLRRRKRRRERQQRQQQNNNNNKNES